MPLDRRMPTGTASIVRQTILLTGVLAVLPLLTYPRTFGLGQFNLHPSFILIEWAAYFGLFLLTLPGMTMSQRFLASGSTVVYRLLCATLFAALAALNSDFSWWDTMAVAMWAYPLSVVPHMILAPIVTRSVWGSVFEERAPRRRTTGFASSQRPARAQWTPTTIGVPPATVSKAETPKHYHPLESSPGFDQAVAYVGGYTGVRMCWLVDEEGLTLAFWQKQVYTDGSDFWAPVSVEIVEFDRRCLSVGGKVNPERVEVRTDAGRLIIEAVGEYWLGVLTDRDADELVGVRLSQAREMVVKHLAERHTVYAGLQEARYV